MKLDLGLAVFIIVVFINTNALVVDYVLAEKDLTTITQLVKYYWWIGVMILILQICGCVGLYHHFYHGD